MVCPIFTIINIHHTIYYLNNKVDLKTLLVADYMQSKGLDTTVGICQQLPSNPSQVF